MSAEVIEVVDGDTLVVRMGTDGVPSDKVRLLGIDTPERGQPGYAEATSHLRSLLSDSVVVLIADPTEEFRRDRYGRILALMRVGDVPVNTAMVRAGWSAFVEKETGSAWRSEFVAAEEEARVAKRGIWAWR